MRLLDVKTGKEVEGEIIEVDESDFKAIKKSKQFEFDWAKEKKYNVFKIVLIEDDDEPPEVHGLISIIDYPDEYRIHINLIENSNDNKSPDKEIDRVAGCLISFAIQIAFENSYNGFTSLVPKTELIGLYTNKYNFSQFGRQLAIQGREAINLIQKYQ